MKIGIISLGCAKNLVDTEAFLGLCLKYELEITTQMDEADILVVNTCGFIESAKVESIDTIMELINYKNTSSKNIVVIAMGCLVERYLNDLIGEIPEIDYYIPISDYNKIENVFQKITNKEESYKFCMTERVLSTPKSCAYLRIGDGCDNKCSYCAIPLIRGKYHSRTVDDILLEAKYLYNKGVKELTLIAQDTTKYGIDLKDASLASLLQSIADLKLFKMIRVLYMYPDEITDELIEVIKRNESIANYFDIPLQHSSDRLLHLMNRRGTCDLYNNLIKKIRNEIPDAIIRTTIIVGFPGETYKDHKNLIDFVKKNRFEHLGAFTYSDEEGTRGYEMSKKVSEKTKNKRYDELMSLQYTISNEINNLYVGKTYECLVEGFDNELGMYKARHYALAPDGVDGYLYLDNKDLNIGEYYKAIINKVVDYEFYGKIIK